MSVSTKDNKMFDDYFNLQLNIHNYFKYKEDWKIIPLRDSREYYWRLKGKGPGKIRFAETPEQLDCDDGNYYEDDIYTQRLFLSKWVYRSKDFTMVYSDTHMDGNKFLRIFDNSKERPNKISTNKGEQNESRTR